MPYDTPSEAFESLVERLQYIRVSGWLVTDSTGSGAHGEAVEAAVGIKRNNSAGADYRGVELKVTTAPKPKIRDLFTLNPTKTHPSIRTVPRAALVNVAGYVDGKGRKALKVTVTGRENRQGLRIGVEDDWVVERLRGGAVATWPLASLRARLFGKHEETCWVVCETRTEESGRSLVLPVGWLRTANPKIGDIAGMINTGVLTLDHRVHVSDGVMRDHGDQWRFKGTVSDLFGVVGGYNLLAPEGTVFPDRVLGTGEVARIPDEVEQLGFEFAG